MNYISTFSESLLHLLFPKLCAGCGSELMRNQQQICLDCINELALTNFFLRESNPVEKMFWGRLPYVAAGSLVYFNKQSVIQRLLHLLKYKGKKDVGRYFGRLMGESIMQGGRFEDVDLLIPLPLHLSREKRRGYNQSAVICEGIAEIMGRPVFTSAVERKRKTETQTRKSRNERWDNMAGVFELKDKDLLNNRHVLLVDDVITTGATLEACGLELLKAQNVRLSVASLAYTTL